MFEEWRMKVIALNRAKRYQESATILREQVKAGEISARAMLARIGGMIGMPGDEINLLIEYVEQNMDLADIDAHLELHDVYDQRLGAIPYDEKARRSFHHLVQAAKLGAGPSFSLAVARIYCTGALTVDINLAESEQWYKRAIEQGSVEAMHEVQKVQNRMRPKST
jgi:TPR repeat protein